MTYFTDSPYEKMMMQKPRYGQNKTSAPKEKPPQKEQKIRKLIIVHEKKDEKSGGV